MYGKLFSKSFHWWPAQAEVSTTRGKCTPLDTDFPFDFTGDKTAFCGGKTGLPLDFTGDITAFCGAGMGFPLDFTGDITTFCGGGWGKSSGATLLLLSLKIK